MKSKNGFTLIEVLGIIVVLGIIAVITVPVITNIIDESKMDAAKDSAYGYINSVNKLYVSKSMSNPDYEITDKYYNVSQVKSLGVNYSGKEPANNSWVSVVDNEVTRGCLQFGVYKVDIINKVVGEVLKGECDTIPSDPVAFETDSWSTIKRAIDEGNTDLYEVGDTKEVVIDDVSYTVRISNVSTPAECNTEGFSQSACGFVFEFEDMISTHRMNPYTDGSINGDGNKGGWEYSEMREYLNSDIYNTLPESLKNVVSDTILVSGHGSSDINNFITTDKLYLVSVTEARCSNSADTAADKTRVLDIYEVSNQTWFEDRRKGGHFWWLRSASNTSIFDYINGGFGSSDVSTRVLGVAPAFRIVKG